MTTESIGTKLTWEQLPQQGNDAQPQSHSHELSLINDGQDIVTADSVIRVPSDKAIPIPSFRKWEVVNGVASISDEESSIIATNPAVLAKIHEEMQRRKAFLMTLNELTDTSTTIGVGAFGGLFGGGIVAQLLTGNNIISGTVAAVSAAVGFFAGIHLFGYDSPLDKLARGSQRRRDKSANRQLSDLVRDSDDVYVIPNRGRFAGGLGKEVVKLLHDAETPKELLAEKVAPLVGAIMQAEVEFVTIEPEVEEIETRTKALGTCIEQDSQNLGDLSEKKKSLQAFVNLSHKQLTEIHGDELKMKSFKERLLELSPDKLELTPELREFCDGVTDAIKVSYEPKFSLSAGSAINDLASVLKTVDGEQLLQEIYEALREKWAPTGIHIPEYEIFLAEIVQKREKR